MFVGFIVSMVQGHDRAKVGGKIPVLRQQASTVAVGESEDGVFGFMQRHAFGARSFEDSAKFFGQTPEIDDDPKVVQKTGEISFLRIGIRDGAGEMAADQSASQRMFPEHYGVYAAGVFGGEIEHA